MNSGRKRALLVTSESQNEDSDATIHVGVGDTGHIPTENQTAPSFQNQNSNLPPEPEVEELRIPRVSFNSDDSGDELGKDAMGRARLRPKGNNLQHYTSFEEFLNMDEPNVDRVGPSNGDMSSYFPDFYGNE